MSEFKAYVGFDIHQDTISVAVAISGRMPPEWCSTIAHCRSALQRLIVRLTPQEDKLSVCSEAGPCGDGVDRENAEMGHHGDVVAPGLVPRGATDRVKTDRRDALMLARLHRAGEMTPVWVPGPEQEARRDLTCAREDMIAFRPRPGNISVPFSCAMDGSIRARAAGHRRTRPGVWSSPLIHRYNTTGGLSGLC